MPHPTFVADVRVEYPQCMPAGVSRSHGFMESVLLRAQRASSFTSDPSTSLVSLNRLRRALASGQLGEPLDHGQRHCGRLLRACGMYITDSRLLGSGRWSRTSQRLAAIPRQKRKRVPVVVRESVYGCALLLIHLTEAKRELSFWRQCFLACCLDSALR